MYEMVRRFKHRDAMSKFVVSCVWAKGSLSKRPQPFFSSERRRQQQQPAASSQQQQQSRKRIDDIE